MQVQVHWKMSIQSTKRPSYSQLTLFYLLLLALEIDGKLFPLQVIFQKKWRRTQATRHTIEAEISFA